ncbi:SCF ubiquitin ligase complex subunit cdc4 [Paramarasmius palmivorus]|uniref:SCF ubiquitin ligase complex subunit cdc4 n=1 Tax=Paramarasmius palmivorus TaxID=297713 RepID=A0AAW0CPN0_9AGAR
MECDGQRYARHLFPLGHGYALWQPEPNHDLPSAYSDHGMRIGDVGIVTDDGLFDFIFNICAAADDPINTSRGVPENFLPLVWNKQIRRNPNLFRPGAPICSRRARQRQLSFEASATVPGTLVGLGGGIEVSFEQNSGAVLMPSKGAERIDCAHRAIFRTYAEENACNWYRFVNGTLGREAENGSLYLVTGFDKADAWETALFDNSSSTQSCSLIFTTNGLVDGRMRLSQASIHQTSVTSRCSAGDAKHNQTLFMRGFRVSTRQGPSAWLLGGTRVASTSSSSRDIFGSTGLFRQNGAYPGSLPPRGSRSSDSAGSGQSNEASIPGGQRYQDLTDNHLSDGCESSTNGSTETDENLWASDQGDHALSDTSVEDDDLDFTPSQVAPYHPLNVINNYILETRSDIDVVVTHDDDWIALLSEEVVLHFESALRMYVPRVLGGYNVLRLTALRIRSAADAHVIFHAVWLNLLPMVSRRLDTEERRSISSGCVFVWEERESNTEATGLGIERWTDSIRWGPSRVKDEFLFYHEKEPEPTELELLGGATGMQQTGRGCSRENLVKQTYSVFVETSRGRRKWHLIAYFTQDSIEYLRTIDDIPALANLHVPPGKYTTARTGKAPRRATATSDPSYNYPYHTTVHRPYPTPTPTQPMVNRARSRSSSSEMLASLEYLENIPPPKRHPIDEEALMLFSTAA